MNNEIKEILDKLKKKEEIYLFQIKNGTSFNSDEYEAHLLLDYITKLQEENKELNDDNIWWNNRYNAIVKQNDDNHKKLVKEQEENKRLVELCNKYEEEHNKTFKIWEKDLKNFEHEKNRELKSRINRQECEIHDLKAKLEMYENGVYFSSENDELQERIDKAIEFIEEELTFYITIGGTDERKLIGYNKAFDELLKILQGSDKE